MLRSLVAATILSITLLTSPAAAQAPHGLRPAPRVVVEMTHAQALHDLHVAQMFATLKRHHDAVLYRAWLAYAAAHAPKTYPHGLCGGDLPPCYVMMRESRGDIRIWNGGCYAPYGWAGRSPCGTSSSSGKWQAIRGSWARYGGFLNAADAPESVQDAWARSVWRGGVGCSNWAAC